MRDLITGIDGFQAYYLIRSADGEATSISAYDSGGVAPRKHSDLSVSPPEVIAGEAVISF